MRQQVTGGPTRKLTWSAHVIRPAMALFTFMIFWTITTARSEADFPSGVQTADVHVARGMVERNARPTDQGTLEERVQALIPDATRNCLLITDQADSVDRSVTPAQSDLTAALRQIQQSETGAWLVKVAASHNVTACLDHATTLEAHYRSHLRLLGLSARLSPASRIVFLAHELAHVPQHPTFSNNRRFSAKDMLLLQRVREAAAEAVATRVLWQLRQQGITAPWQEKLATAYHDIAEKFEVTMAGGQGLARELWATRSAFHHWFDADWRRQIYDDLMLKTLARIAGDPIGIIPTSKYLSDRYLRGIGHYAGQSFLIGGDGSALMQGFRAQGLQPGDQARLDAILTNENVTPTSDLTVLNAETLSAVSPRRASEPRDIPVDHR